MSIKLMNAVWESDTTSGSDRLVLLALADSANDEGYCWPAYDTIAAKANLGRRYVIQIVGRLEEIGLIVKTHRFKEGDFTSNLYRVVVNNSSPGVVNHSSPPSEQGFTRVVNHSSLKPPINLNNNNGEIFSTYESEIGMLSPHVSDMIQDAEKDYPQDWIIEAIKIAAKSNKRNWGYVEGILKRWKAEGKNNGKKEYRPEEHATEVYQ